MRRNFVLARYARLFLYSSMQRDARRSISIVLLEIFCQAVLGELPTRFPRCISRSVSALQRETLCCPFRCCIGVHRERLILALTHRVEYYTTRFERRFACIHTRGHASIFHEWRHESILNSFIQFFHVLSGLSPGYKQWCLIACQHLHGYANLYRSIQSRSTQ